MASESDRIARAGDYVFGLMNDVERRRAERDLEIDPAFRDAVLRLAERMRAFDPAAPADGATDKRWDLVTRRIAELPQMRLAGVGGGDSGEEAGPTMIRRLERPPYGVGLHALGGRRGFAIALALVAAFALGYLTGAWSADGMLVP
ncbi:hypothetical protein EN858_09100 [Mesorhizobium sp. M4B.F.Ca.ET.215.01.1.1]|uniref:hypothetical protein n=2 Tax=Mesorhizobium TaxID=68287 RepID=UPI000FCA9698|nr:MULTISPECIES: hypothetical protein [unclassified Mesorhizobium]RVC59651.1 hypothetical protein EN779_15555 [Mesorhizobium sp. M4B.F.Ca.ET.088.02.2.1]RUW27638.1 hypothetical protein EOA34_04165 [Mesorhizobium sp. M4B.F.Ca.ET.013.02.1.1]RVD45694.1 hypothetical protein EN741_04365 [Mesorhizobium sp. M4B.F.Ca.ET.019.03.1.1]RWA62835.1 MAG: hypothetical protein EOQ27_15230 [Mesorhizobium sp.]RWF27563.1 MAG: hypothetical protein EOS45_25550 [Mesorhizobium sp.]